MTNQEIAEQYVAEHNSESTKEQLLLNALEYRSKARKARLERCRTKIEIYANKLQGAEFNDAVALAFEAAAAKKEAEEGEDALMAEARIVVAGYKNYTVGMLRQATEDWRRWADDEQGKSALLRNIFLSRAKASDEAADKLEAEEALRVEAREFVATHTNYGIREFRKRAEDNRRWRDAACTSQCAAKKYNAAARAFDEAADKLEAEERAKAEEAAVESDEAPLDLLTVAQSVFDRLEERFKSTNLNERDYGYMLELAKGIANHKRALAPEPDSMEAYCNRLGIALPTTELPTEPGMYWGKYSEESGWETIILPKPGDIKITLGGPALNSRSVFGWKWLGPIPTPPGGQNNHG